MLGYSAVFSSSSVELIIPPIFHSILDCPEQTQTSPNKTSFNSKTYFQNGVFKNIVKYKPLEDILELYEEHNALDALNVALPHQNDRLQD